MIVAASHFFQRVEDEHAQEHHLRQVPQLGSDILKLLPSSFHQGSAMK